ncbi:MAG: hypothetical protein LM557_04480, partial [Desulfurococcaceae archaeon]|nr:hypothetical protein [Desulfurococcaceae archaeon]
MKRLLGLGLVILALLVLSAMPRSTSQQTGRTIVIAVDLAHNEGNKYLSYIQGNITSVTVDGVTYPIQWVNITDTTITSDLLANIDILLIGQPTVGFAPEEMDAIKSWLLKGNKALYIAGDSDYGGGPASIDAVNSLLTYLGSKLRLEHAGVYTYVNDTYTYKGVDQPTAAAAYYRVLAFVEPDPVLYASMVDEGITKPIIMHGPTCVIWYDGENYRDPVNETYPGLIRLVWFRRAYIGDNQPPTPYLYSPLIYGTGTYNSFVGYAAEYYADLNSVITVAGESLYGDYEPAWASSYYGVELDGPKFVTNLVKWWVKLITTSVLSFTDPEGDDKGTGNITYPTNTVFKPGVFDIVKFQVLQDENYIYLRTTVKDLGGNPWNGPNGFCLQIIFVYIMTTDTTIPVNTSAPGLNVTIYPGWHYMAVAAPGWGGEPWPGGQAGALYASNGTLITGEGDLFDVYYAGDNSIDIKISKTLLVDVANLENWVFTVALAGYDGFQTWKVRPVQPGPSTEWNFGGADPSATLAGVQPLVIDFLAPTAEDQYNALTTYDPATGKLAVIFGMSKTGP